MLQFLKKKQSNSSYMLFNVNSILQSTNIKHYEFFCNINSVTGKVRCLGDDQNWHREIVKELLWILDGQWTAASHTGTSVISLMTCVHCNACCTHIHTLYLVYPLTFNNLFKFS